ncbi:hypothetical protein JTB14_033002 [Gonioctena quinquepunctata]|nr:hypothetical protein JTB14_033002 [Gonioctena quinquepunctata]
MKDAVNLLKQLTQDIHDINTQNKVIFEQLDGLRQELKDFRTEVASELSALKNDNEELKVIDNKLQKRLQTAERKHKKYNLVVYENQEDEMDTH